MTEIAMVYDASAKRAVLTFPGGRTLAIKDVTEEQAKAFRDKHGAEFQKRDCRLSSIDGLMTRESPNGE